MNWRKYEGPNPDLRIVKLADHVALGDGSMQVDRGLDEKGKEWRRTRYSLDDGTWGPWSEWERTGTAEN